MSLFIVGSMVQTQPGGEDLVEMVAFDTRVEVIDRELCGETWR